MAKKKSVLLDKPLTEVQEKFVNDVCTGVTTAGHGSTGRSAQVKAALEDARTDLRNLSTLTRLDVINGIMEGIDMAKLMAEPASVIKGWVDISKILGFDTPEVRKTSLSNNATALQNKLLSMTTAQLLEIAAGNLNVVDGECTRVDH